MEKLELMMPTLEYENEILAFRQDFFTREGSMDGSGSLRKIEDVREWIGQVERMKSKETVPEGLVPMTQFIYVRESDHKVVGVIQIRHELNDYLEKFSGHIGYSVCPSERRKGYATRMLHDALLYCRTLGLNKVLIACLTENEGSRRTILNNGGVYFETVHEPKRNIQLEKYWIDTGAL